MIRIVLLHLKAGMAGGPDVIQAPAPGGCPYPPFAIGYKTRNEIVTQILVGPVALHQIMCLSALLINNIQATTSSPYPQKRLRFYHRVNHLVIEGAIIGSGTSINIREGLKTLVKTVHSSLFRPHPNIVLLIYPYHRNKLVVDAEGLITGRQTMKPISSKHKNTPQSTCNHPTFAILTNRPNHRVPQTTVVVGTVAPEHLAPIIKYRNSNFVSNPNAPPVVLIDGVDQRGRKLCRKITLAHRHKSSVAFVQLKQTAVVGYPKLTVTVFKQIVNICIRNARPPHNRAQIVMDKRINKLHRLIHNQTTYYPMHATYPYFIVRAYCETGNSSTQAGIQTFLILINQMKAILLVGVLIQALQIKHPQIPLIVLSQLQNDSVGKTSGGSVGQKLKHIAPVKAIESVPGPKPHKTIHILNDARHIIVRQTLRGGYFLNTGILILPLY